MEKDMELFVRFPVACMLVNTVGKPGFIFNSRFQNLLGYSQEELVAQMNKDYSVLFDENDLMHLREQLIDAAGTDATIKHRIKMYTKEGKRLYTIVEAMTSERNDGDYYLCSVTDVTEMVEIQNMLRREQRRLKTVMECTQDVIYEYYIEEDRMTLYKSNGANKLSEEAWYEYENFSMLAMEKSIIHKEDIFLLYPLWKGKEFERIELRMRAGKKSKDYVWVEMMGAILMNDEGHPDISIGIIRNIDDTKQKTLALKKKAERDSLTGLYNHTALRTQIDQYFEEGGGKEKTNALVVIDLDDFKMVNDTYGHRFGDKVIKEVAQILSATFGENDIIGRIGGDEYLVFCKDMLEMTVIKEKLTSMFDYFENNPIGLRDKYVVKASVGVAVSPQDGTTYKKLFDRADRNMYAVKRSGKNTYTFHE